MAKSAPIFLHPLRHDANTTDDYFRQKLKEKDLEVQSLRRALKSQPAPTTVQSPPISPAHKRGLDGSRLVTRAKIDVSQTMKRGALAPA